MSLKADSLVTGYADIGDYRANSYHVLTWFQADTKSCQHLDGSHLYKDYHFKLIIKPKKLAWGKIINS